MWLNIADVDIDPFDRRDTLPDLDGYDNDVQLSERFILPGSLAVAGWRLGSTSGELFEDASNSFALVTHHGDEIEVEVNVPKDYTRQHGEESWHVNIIRAALSSNPIA